MNLNPSLIKDKILEYRDRLIGQLKETKRVLKITEKPDTEEFKMSAKITGAGMIIIGAIGFAFYLASSIMPQL